MHKDRGSDIKEYFGEETSGEPKERELPPNGLIGYDHTVGLTEILLTLLLLVEAL